MIFAIKLAGIIIEIHSLYNHVFNLCQNYLFSCDKSKTPAIIIKTTENDLDKEYQVHNAIDNKCKEGEYCFYNPGILETVSVYRKICDELPKYNTFMFHGAAVAKNGFAYMFTAPSGIGKSTRAKLWIDEYKESIIINGDKPLLQINDNQVYVCGTPWCGKESWNTNISLPLHSIFLLERTEINENSSIRSISFSEASDTMLAQTYIPAKANALIQTVSLVKRLEGKVKLYSFRSAPTREAIRLAYETANSDLFL